MQQFLLDLWNRRRFTVVLVTHDDKDGYFHVEARPVTLGLNAWERRRIDEGATFYRDVTPNTIRNCGDDLVSGLRLGGIVVSCQGNDDDAERHVYGYEVAYREAHKIDAHDARAPRCFDDHGADVAFEMVHGHERFAHGLRQRLARHRRRLAHDPQRRCRRDDHRRQRGGGHADQPYGGRA
mgnify:CR=1 FL=1